LFNQILRFELGPELGRDFGLHGGVIRKDLLFTPATDNQGRGNIGCRRELQSGSPKINPIIICGLTQSPALSRNAGGILYDSFP